MNDAKIVELYWSRSEEAIGETQMKYGKYCQTISYNILGNTSDAEECVNIVRRSTHFTHITHRSRDRHNICENLSVRLQCV